MTASSPALGVRLFAGLVGGALATFVKSKAEDTLQPLAEKALPPEPAQKAELGADPAGHPENMPPSELADRAVHAVTGDELSDEARQKVSSPLHWFMGVTSGVAYAAAAGPWPAVRAGHGLAFGAGLFGATHGSTLPAAGLQHPPSMMPKAWWVWEGGSHLIYGVVLDTTVRLVEATVRRVRS